MYKCMVLLKFLLRLCKLIHKKIYMFQIFQSHNYTLPRRWRGKKARKQNDSGHHHDVLSGKFSPIAIVKSSWFNN